MGHEQLCGYMWGYNLHTRVRRKSYPRDSGDVLTKRSDLDGQPAWATALFLVLSFLCGIFAAVLIFFGTSRSRKTYEVEVAIKVRISSHPHP